MMHHRGCPPQNSSRVVALLMTLLGCGVAACRDRPLEENQRYATTAAKRQSAFSWTFEASDNPGEPLPSGFIGAVGKVNFVATVRLDPFLEQKYLLREGSVHLSLVQRDAQGKVLAEWTGIRGFSKKVESVQLAQGLNVFSATVQISAEGFKRTEQQEPIYLVFDTQGPEFNLISFSRLFKDREMAEVQLSLTTDSNQLAGCHDIDLFGTIRGGREQLHRFDEAAKPVIAADAKQLDGIEQMRLYVDPKSGAMVRKARNLPFGTVTVPARYHKNLLVQATCEDLRGNMRTVRAEVPDVEDFFAIGLQIFPRHGEERGKLHAYSTSAAPGTPYALSVTQTEGKMVLSSVVAMRPPSPVGAAPSLVAFYEAGSAQEAAPVVLFDLAVTNEQGASLTPSVVAQKSAYFDVILTRSPVAASPPTPDSSGGETGTQQRWTREALEQLASQTAGVAFHAGLHQDLDFALDPGFGPQPHEAYLSVFYSGPDVGENRGQSFYRDEISGVTYYNLPLTLFPVGDFVPEVRVDRAPEPRILRPVGSEQLAKNVPTSGDIYRSGEVVFRYSYRGPALSGFAFESYDATITRGSVISEFVGKQIFFADVERPKRRWAPLGFASLLLPDTPTSTGTALEDPAPLIQALGRRVMIGQVVVQAEPANRDDPFEHSGTVTVTLLHVGSLADEPTFVRLRLIDHLGQSAGEAVSPSLFSPGFWAHRDLTLVERFASYHEDVSGLVDSGYQVRQARCDQAPGSERGRLWVELLSAATCRIGDQDYLPLRLENLSGQNRKAIVPVSAEPQLPYLVELGYDTGGGEGIEWVNQTNPSGDEVLDIQQLAFPPEGLAPGASTTTWIPVRRSWFIREVDGAEQRRRVRVVFDATAVQIDPDLAPYGLNSTELQGNNGACHASQAAQPSYPTLILQSDPSEQLSSSGLQEVDLRRLQIDFTDIACPERL